MDHSIERSGSPLYDAIREVMAGSWPEDEYDVAESPLSYVDYKSQVFFDIDGPVAPVVNTGVDGASDTDFESLESDESGWGGEVDDTMATEIETEVSGKPNADSNGVAGSGEMLQGLFEVEEGKEGSVVEEKKEENNGRKEEGKEEGIIINPGSTIGTEGDIVPREEILEGPEEAIGSEIELTIATIAETELRGEIEEIFRTEIAAEVERAFNGMTDNEIKTENSTTPKAEQVAAEATGGARKVTEGMMPTRLIIPPVPIDRITPIEDDYVEPPPIPSRSPSRPGTSMANRRALNEAPAVFAPQQRCDSSLSLPQARVTASSLSSPRSSRFFEDLAEPEKTSTDIEAEKSPLSPPLPPPPSRKESDDSDVKEPLKKKERKEKKRNRFFRSCGLETLFKKLKLGESKLQKQSGSKGHPRVTSVASIIKW